MFENAKPFPAAQDARFSENSEGEVVRDSESLRELEWSELTARLSAARDLRLVLRRDVSQHVGEDSSSFADAAAQYFRTRNENEDYYEPGVNPVALEHCKGSAGMVQEQEETNRLLHNEAARDTDHAATGPMASKAPDSGDAREDK